MRIFEHKKLKELDFSLRTNYNLGGRVYTTPDGKRYPSVTTILAGYNKEAILKWRQKVGEEEANRITKAASSRGSRFHDICEKYLLNELKEDDMQELFPDAKHLYQSVKPELDKSIGNVYCLEQDLYSDRLKVAGRVDCIAEWDGVLSVIDFKNSLKPKKEEWINNYFMQCTTYACMFAERTNIPVRQIVVLIGVVDSQTPQVFIKKTSDMLEETIGYIREYHRTA